MDGPHTIHSILFCSIRFRLGSTFAVISYNMASRLIMFILFGITKMRFLNIIWYLIDSLSIIIMTSLYDHVYAYISVLVLV